MKYEAKNLKQINKLINTGEPVLIYFSSETCSICKPLKNKLFFSVQEAFSKFNLCEVKVEKHQEIASTFQVFSSPLTLVFFDKKEFIREGRNMSVKLFVNKLKRLYEMSIT